jgi:hypothetical protein
MAWQNRRGLAGRNAQRRLVARWASLHRRAWDLHGSWPEGVRKNDRRPERTVDWRQRMREDGLQGEKTVPGRFRGLFFDRAGACAVGRAPHLLRAVLQRDAWLAHRPSRGGTERLRVPRPVEAVARRLVCGPGGPMVLVDRACPPQPRRLVWPVAALRRAYPAVRRRAWHRAAARCAALPCAVLANLAGFRWAGCRAVLQHRALRFQAGCRLEEKTAAWVRTMAGIQRRGGRRIARRRPSGGHPWPAARRS